MRCPTTLLPLRHHPTAENRRKAVTRRVLHMCVVPESPQNTGTPLLDNIQMDRLEHREAVSGTIAPAVRRIDSQITRFFLTEFLSATLTCQYPRKQPIVALQHDS